MSTIGSGAKSARAGAPLSAERRLSVEAGRAGQQPNEPIPRGADLMPVTALISEEVSRPEAEPVVRITIGRVEVRAIPSGTASPTPQRPPERRVMSLAEYLDRRSKGTSP